MNFDPYHKWLGIPTAEQPPNHYRLLAIALFEPDPDIIETAADLRMSHLRTYQTGPHSALSQKLLNEVAAAKLCLLDPARKAAYDAELRRRAEMARPPAPPAPIATAMAPMPLRVVAPMSLAVAGPTIGYTPPSSRAAIPEQGTQSEQLAVDIRLEPAQFESRPKLDRRWLAITGASGITVGFLLCWLILWGTGRRAQQETVDNGAKRAEKESSKSGSIASLQNEFAEMLRSVERPGSLGVKAEKLVIWNAHSGPNNDVGTLECNVRLFADGREIWTKQAVAVPWAPNEDRNVSLVLPSERFDQVRVEITKWERVAGGLAEIQVVSADGRNLALGCPVIASGAWHGKVGPEHITDGVTTSAEVDVGAWLLPPRIEGWVEVDLSLPRPTDLGGVIADKLVIWNQHNAHFNDRGALESNVRIFANGREIWSKQALQIPWAPNEDGNTALELPPIKFDRVRLEITKWQQLSGGLAEVQVVRGGKNLSLHCPAISPAAYDEWRSGRRITDGILSSQGENVGYWALPDRIAGWVEVDLACLDAEYGLSCRQLGLALAVVDGDWQRGLLWLARGDHATLRRLALADSQDVYDTPEQLALADAWWELAQQAEGAVRKRLLARSLWRYRQAFPKLREFRKAQVQSRFDQALPGLPERDYLYFMPDTELKLGWGMLRDAFPISVRGQRSPYALFMHAIANDSAHAAFHLGKRYRRFRGAAAINDPIVGVFGGELTFRIVADGREVWKSRPLRAADSSQPFDLDVRSVSKLELFVDCSGSNGARAHSVWIEPRCER